MSLGTDALTLVKDVKKFEAKLAELARAEEGAASAITRANIEANEITAEAGRVLSKAKKRGATAKRKLEQVEAQLSECDLVVLSAQEESQRANAHEARLGKAKEKLVEDLAGFEKRVDWLRDKQVIFDARVAAFRDRVTSLCRTILD